MGSSKVLMSKSTRIKIMIAIDSGFFLLELISGFLAHSLALTADAFHMVRCPNPQPAPRTSHSDSSPLS